MRIGILCYPSIGGSGLIATELGLGLAERGHQVHFISYAAPFRLRGYEENVHFHEVDPINYPLFQQTLYTFSLTAKIVEVAKTHDLDLVHAHYSIPHSLCAHLAREVSHRDFRIVTTLHGTDVSIVGQDKPFFELNRYGIEQSDSVTTVSQFQKDHTAKYFNIASEIEVIHNFVDSGKFVPSSTCCCRRRFARENEKIIMHISNLREPKNPVGVIEAFARVRQEIPARLVIVGDGPGSADIRRIGREHSVLDSVEFVGSINDVEGIIPIADCVFQPSYRESFGMVTLEAMACGIPTVSSNVDGVPEVVVDGETGFMADPDDHEKLAQHMIRLCRDPALAQHMGKQGRARAVESFNPNKAISHYLACYKKILA